MKKVFLMFVMIATMFFVPAEIFAADMAEPYVIETEPIETPADQEEELVGSQDIPTAYSLEEFVDLYGRLSNEAAETWDEEFQIAIVGDYTPEQVRGLIVQSLFPHNGKPAEGDYADWNHAGITYSFRVSEGQILVDSCVEYYTTKAQEAALTTKLNQVMKWLDLDTKTEYEKVKAIYDYIAGHVTYDYGNDDLKYTAYAALVNGTAVCQGYATLFYRMCLTAGVDARVITGGSVPGYNTHAWNIVRIGDLYYNVDATWDAGYAPEEYDYFLRGQENFDSHFRYGKYDTAEFYEEYPTSAADCAVPAITDETVVIRETTAADDPTTDRQPVEDWDDVEEEDINLFGDVLDPTHPYYKAVYWAADTGITKGYPGTGLFGINDSCTRSQAMMFLWRIAGKPEPKRQAKSPFSDIKPSHPHYKAVLWAYQKGIAKGFGNGTYGVDTPCTRGQIMMFLWRYAGKPTPAGNAKRFRDKITPAFRTAILWGSQKGITKGYPDGTFKDSIPCTRGQIVTFLYRNRNN